MFEENPSQKPNRPSPPTFQTGQPQQVAQPPQRQGPMDIHTMPSKFMKKEKRGGGKKKLLIILLVVVIFAGVAGAAVFLFDRLSTPENSNSVVVNENLNENENINTNANINTNLNINTNTNLNVNVNTNANVNTNSNINSNTNTSTTITPPLSTSDNDDDGLTDVEEALWGTEVGKPDTDGDGYQDGKKILATGEIIGELYLGYDPTAANTRLESTSLVKRYTNTTYNWSMLYPSKWSASQVSSATGDANIMFSTDAGTLEYMQVSVQENPTRLSAKNWYLSLNPSVEPAQVEEVVVNGLQGIRSPDTTSVYLSREDKIYLIAYNIGGLTRVNYMTTFEMMFQSFKLTSTSTNANSNTNGS